MPFQEIASSYFLSMLMLKEIETCNEIFYITKKQEGTVVINYAGYDFNFNPATSSNLYQDTI